MNKKQVSLKLALVFCTGFLSLNGSSSFAFDQHLKGIAIKKNDDGTTQTEKIKVDYSSSSTDARIIIGKNKYKAVRDGAVVKASHFIKGSVNDAIWVYLEPGLKKSNLPGDNGKYYFQRGSSGYECESADNLILEIIKVGTMSYDGPLAKVACIQLR